MSEDAKTVILAHLRAALNELVDNNDYDGILYVVALMRKVHDS